MKKFTIFLMMLCFACLGVAKAQTLTIPEEGVELTTNEYIPVYGYYADTDGCTSEFIIPARSLATMSGNDITAMTFYISTAASGDWGATFQVYLGEVNETTLDENYGPANFSIVYEGELDGTGTTMSIEFEEPYHYNGGNLLVGTYVLSSGSWIHAYFSGYEATGAAYYSYEGWNGMVGSVQNFIPQTTFTYERPAACPKPTGLTATDNGDGTATVTWNGTAANDFNITINGRTTAGVTSPYTFDVEASTTYAITVTADCGTAGTSEPASTSLTTHCLATEMCSITLALTDSYGDGWNGGKMQVVDATTGEVYGNYTISSGASAEYELALCPGTVVNFVYTSGSYAYENGWTIYDPAGETINEHTAGGTAATSGIQATYTMDCSGCFKPSNLQETNITTNSATLSWSGNNDSYVLQYRPWYPAGDDIIATGTMTTYTVDLSAYTGIGSVAIRHYDVSDMFRLNIDDIVVTNANGEVIFSEDFESGDMPSAITNMDLDGDGYVWEIVTNGTDSQGNSTGNGTYAVASASYDNSYGVLYPDNWMIISGLEMGGSISFGARGQDPAYAAENFAIYVSTESSIVEIPVTATTYNATNLIPNTPYAWQVKGVCGEDETSYVSSFFKTKDDKLVFATAGNWNVIANWKDAEGNAVTALPTADNNVSIEAAAEIPAGVVAQANKITIDGGSITIKDGGQLKQSAATLRVTVEKEITGYGESDGYYYFIASPFNGRTKFGNDGSTWSLVDNILEGEYDLYAFDPTNTGTVDGETVALEWVNYEYNPSHISFLSEPTSSGSSNPGMLYGEGYLYANQEGTTLEFIGTTGKSNSYSEVRDYTYDSEATEDWNGWKLVGNMFTCNGYINYVDADGKVLDADFYTLNNDNSYTLSESSVALAPCTGAFINYAASGKVQYSTEAPAKRTGMINMNVSRNNKTVSQARLRFGQGFNLGSMSFRNGSRLYMPVEGNDYAVVYTENQGEMPVSFRAAENGNYTLSFNTENVELGYLHLIDNMTGKDVDLLSTPSYSFEAKTTDYASRFKLVFATGNADDSFAFFSNGSFVINNEGNATLQVMDVTGRMISSENINGCANVNVNATPGVYMIRLVNGENVKVQKVVVR